MANFKGTIITTKGHSLIAKAVANTATISFTKIATSSYDYTNATNSDLESLINLSDIKQYAPIDKVQAINTSYKVFAKFTNKDLVESYYIRAIGLFATDPDEGEILYSVTVAENADWFPADNDVNCSGINLDLNTGISNTSNVTLNVNYSGYATNEDIEKVNSQLNEIENDNKGLTYLSTTVFKQNVDFSSKYFRIPFGCVTKNGVIVAGSDIRYQGSSDQSYIDIGIARSVDGGKTWQDKKIAMRNNNVNPNYSRVMDGTILYDEDRNRIYLLGNYWNTRTDNWTNSNTHKDSDWDIKLCYSDDEGLNWSEPISLRDLCPSTVSQFIGGVGSGIKTSNGTLIFPIQLAKLNDSPYNVQSGLMYSSDGVNWSISESYVSAYTSECNVFEYCGEIYINCRQEGSNKRAIYKTSNLGITWTYCSLSDNTPQPNACMGSTIKIHTDDNLEDLILFSCVNSSTRGNLTLKVLNFNDTKFNNVINYYNKNSDGYSCLIYDKWNKKLFSIFETLGNLQFTDLTPSLQNCYLEKSKEIEFEQKIIQNRLYVYVSPSGSDENDGSSKENALRTFKKIPFLANNNYESVWIYLDPNYTDDIRISNILPQVTIVSMDSSPITFNRPYIRNCTSINIRDNCNISLSYSEDFVIALENTLLLVANKLNIKSTANSEIFAYLSNAKLSINQYSDEHEIKVIQTLVSPIDCDNYLSILISQIPNGEIQFVDSLKIPGKGGGIDIYVANYPGSDVNIIQSGTQLVDNSITSRFLTRNISCNNIIKGISELNSNLNIMGGEVTSILCKSRIEPVNWRFTTSQDIATNTVLFKLPTALLPKSIKYLTGICITGTNITGICIKIDTNGYVFSYGKIPNNSEIVINTSYSLY